jgi:hypothetical protein
MYTCALPGLLNHLNQHFVSFLLRHISVPVFVPETTNSPSETFALLQDARQLSPNPIGPRQFIPWLSEDKKGHHWVRNRYLMGEMMANWGGSGQDHGNYTIYSWIPSFQRTFVSSF